MFTAHEALYKVFGQDDPLQKFLEFLTQFEKTMMRASLQILSSPDQAELAVRNTYIYLATHPNMQIRVLDKLAQGQKYLRSFLFALSENRAKNILFEEYNRVFIPLDSVIIRAEELTPEDRLLLREFTDHLHKFFETHDNVNTATLKLLADGSTISEIAAALRISPDTVRQRLHRARKEVAQWLRDLGYNIDYGKEETREIPTGSKK